MGWQQNMVRRADSVTCPVCGRVVRRELRYADAECMLFVRHNGAGGEPCPASKCSRSEANRLAARTAADKETSR